LLLDTHVLLWLVSTPHKVGASAREVLTDRRAEVSVDGVGMGDRHQNALGPPRRGTVVVGVDRCSCGHVGS
jgi:hypothetical protein